MQSYRRASTRTQDRSSVQSPAPDRPGRPRGAADHSRHDLPDSAPRARPGVRRAGLRSRCRPPRRPPTCAGADLVPASEQHARAAHRDALPAQRGARRAAGCPPLKAQPAAGQGRSELQPGDGSRALLRPRQPGRQHAAEPRAPRHRLPARRAQLLARREHRLGQRRPRHARARRSRAGWSPRGHRANILNAPASATSASASRSARPRTARAMPAATYTTDFGYRATPPAHGPRHRRAPRRLGSRADAARRAAPSPALRPRRRGPAAGPRGAAVRRHRPRAARRAAGALAAQRRRDRPARGPRRRRSLRARRRSCSTHGARRARSCRTTSPRSGRSCRTTPPPTAGASRATASSRACASRTTARARSARTSARIPGPKADRLQPHPRDAGQPLADLLAVLRPRAARLARARAGDRDDEPFGEVTDADGTRNRLWRVADPDVDRDGHGGDRRRPSCSSPTATTATRPRASTPRRSAARARTATSSCASSRCRTRA